MRGASCEHPVINEKVDNANIAVCDEDIYNKDGDIALICRVSTPWNWDVCL